MSITLWNQEESGLSQLCLPTLGSFPTFPSSTSHLFWLIFHRLYLHILLCKIFVMLRKNRKHLTDCGRFRQVWAASMKRCRTNTKRTEMQQKLQREVNIDQSLLACLFLPGACCWLISHQDILVPAGVCYEYVGDNFFCNKHISS